MATASQHASSEANLVRRDFAVVACPRNVAVMLVNPLIKANALLWAWSGQGLKS